MIVLYDDARARAFEPFATSRPLGEVRAGACLGRERWATWFPDPIAAFLGAPHLTHFAEFAAPPMASLPLPAGCWVVNTRALPVLATGTIGAANVLRIAERVAAVRLADGLDDIRLLDGSLPLEALVPPDAVALSLEGVWLDEPWDIVRHLVDQLQHDIPALAAALHIAPMPRTIGSHSPVVLGAADVFVEEGAQIEPMVVFDTHGGPVLIRRGSTVQSFTRIVGPCYIGRDCTVTADRIAASSIGDTCRVHGELSTSVLIGHANKGHDGFVGHSVLGRWVNLGAGTITSNLKNTYGTVALWTPGGMRDTGLQFAGTFFGDHVKTGIGMRLTTGCVLGAGANVMDRMPPKVVAPFSWGTGAPYTIFADEQFFTTAERVMARRHVILDERERRHLQAVMTHALADRRWPAR